MKPDFSIVPERPIVENDPNRCFSPKQRLQIFDRAKGCCELCGIKIRGTWIAGHIIAHALGGRTTIDNGRVECLDCAPETHSEDTDSAARCKRLQGKTGQQARRKRNGPRLKSSKRKWPKRAFEKMEKV